MVIFPVGTPAGVIRCGFPQDLDGGIEGACSASSLHEWFLPWKFTGGILFARPQVARRPDDPRISRAGRHPSATANNARRDFQQGDVARGAGDYDLSGHHIAVCVGFDRLQGGRLQRWLRDRNGHRLFAARRSALLRPFETITAYEAGIKGRFADGVASNGSLFHYDYKGMQLRLFVDHLRQSLSGHDQRRRGEGRWCRTGGRVLSPHPAHRVSRRGGGGGLRSTG